MVDQEVDSNFEVGQDYKVAKSTKSVVAATPGFYPINGYPINDLRCIFPLNCPSLPTPPQVIPEPACRPEQDLLLRGEEPPLDGGVARKEEVVAGAEAEVDLDPRVGLGGSGGQLPAGAKFNGEILA